MMLVPLESGLLRNFHFFLLTMTSQDVLFTYWLVDTVIIFGSGNVEIHGDNMVIPWCQPGPEVLSEVSPFACQLSDPSRPPIR